LVPPQLLARADLAGGVTLEVSPLSGQSFILHPIAGTFFTINVNLTYCRADVDADIFLASPVTWLPANASLVLNQGATPLLNGAKTLAQVTSDGTCFRLNLETQPEKEAQQFGTLAVLLLPPALPEAPDTSTVFYAPHAFNAIQFLTRDLRVLGTSDSDAATARRRRAASDPFPLAQDPGPTVRTADLIPPHFISCPEDLVLVAPPGQVREHGLR
jgi:hypothetical protein